MYQVISFKLKFFQKIESLKTSRYSIGKASSSVEYSASKHSNEFDFHTFYESIVMIDAIW